MIYEISKGKNIMGAFARRTLLTAVLALGLFPAIAIGDEPPIVTVAGDIEHTNRDPVTADDVGMFTAHDIEFEKGYSLTRQALANLDQVTYSVKVPGKDGLVTLQGPLLTDVLTLAAAKGTAITVMALDGYGIEMPLSYIKTHKPILAIKADGTSLAIGDMGPAMTVFPSTDDPKLAEEFASRQIWAVFLIDVK